jgi:hypothetical protein
MAYIYRADIYCDDCGRAICERLQAAGKAPADPDNGWSYDSDDYPKRAGDDEESDTPEHCAAGERCVNAIRLPSGGMVGHLFGELTLAGVEYVKESLEEATAGFGSKEVVELWQQHYRNKGYDL